MEIQSIVREVAVSELVPAEWNPKAAGSDEVMERLVNSIVEDKSYGVPAVRKLKDGRVEVIDGNHRLAAIVRLGLEVVRVEDFGDISKAKAILIAHRRNAQWFEEDQLAMANLLIEDVLPEYEDLATIAAFMPESLTTLENMADMAAGNWDMVNGEPKAPPSDDKLTEKIAFRVDPDTYMRWLEWKKACAAEGGDRDVDCFAALLNAAEAVTDDDR